ncbi:hypothetical protein ACLOJK_031311 [Asimina triloba]
MREGGESEKSGASPSPSRSHIKQLQQTTAMNHSSNSSSSSPMDSMAMEATTTTAAAATDPTPPTPPLPSSSIPETPPTHLLNPQPQQQPQSPQQASQPRPTLARGRPQPQPPYSTFSSHLPTLASSSTPSSSFSSAPSPSSSSPMPRGGPALGVPARPHQLQQPSPPFSSFGHPPFSSQFGGLARGSLNMNEQMANSNNQVECAQQPLQKVYQGRPIQGIHNLGTMGGLGTGSQMRPSGAPGHQPQRPGQPPLRSQSPSSNQSMATQVDFQLYF